MNHQFIEAREFVAKAREALRRGDRPSARQLGEQAALRAPNMEDAWLILAASDPDPREALAYARKALELNPQSVRARRGVEWATDQLKQAPARTAEKAHAPVPPKKIVPNQVEALTGLPKKHAYQTAVALPQLTAERPNWLLPALLTGVGFVLVGFIILFALTRPALASFVSRIAAPAAPQEKLWAHAEVAKPEVTPIHGSAFSLPQGATAASPTASLRATATLTEVPAASLAPADVPIEAPSATPAPTETPGTMAMQVLADTPTSAYVAPTYSAPKAKVVSPGNGVRWIDVDRVIVPTQHGKAVEILLREHVLEDDLLPDRQLHCAAP